MVIRRDFLCTLHFLCRSLFHQGYILVQCANFGLQNEKHPVSPHNYNYSTNPHLMFSFNGPQVKKLSAECPPFQSHLSLAFNSTFPLPKMQNCSLSTINTARAAQTVQWLEHGPDNLGFDFWQRQDIPTLQNTDTRSGACPAYSKGSVVLSLQVK